MAYFLFFNETEIMREEIYKKILFDKLTFNEGMIIENIVAQDLIFIGRKLYFFSKNEHNFINIKLKRSMNYIKNNSNYDTNIIINDFLNKKDYKTINSSLSETYNNNSTTMNLSQTKISTNQPFIGMKFNDLTTDNAPVWINKFKKGINKILQKLYHRVLLQNTFLPLLRGG